MKISASKRFMIVYPAIMFGILLMLSNVTAAKIFQWRFFVVPVAVFVYPFTFAMTDVISEIWGRKAASRVVKAGFIGQLIALLLIQLMLRLKPAPFCKIDPEFHVIFGSSSRIIIASLLAYVISQTHDVYAFHFWKSMTRGRKLWLRNNASTIVSQLLDTAIFITFAFWGLVPEKVILQMIGSQYLFKVIIALLDTPFVYLLVKAISGQWAVKEEWGFN